MIGAGAPQLDALPAVAAHVAVGDVGPADDVVMGTAVQQDLVVGTAVAARALPVVVAAIRVEADPVADDDVVMGIRTVDHKRPKVVGQDHTTDRVSGAVDAQTVAARQIASAADLDAGDCIRPERERVRLAAGLRIAVDERPAGSVIEQRRRSGIELDGYRRRARDIEVDLILARPPVGLGDGGAEGAVSRSIGTRAVARVGVGRIQRAVNHEVGPGGSGEHAIVR